MEEALNGSLVAQFAFGGLALGALGARVFAVEIDAHALSDAIHEVAILRLRHYDKGLSYEVGSRISQLIDVNADNTWVYVKESEHVLEEKRLFRAISLTYE